jgi:hypothetical protein
MELVIQNKCNLKFKELNEESAKNIKVLGLSGYN